MTDEEIKTFREEPLLTANNFYGYISLADILAILDRLQSAEDALRRLRVSAAVLQANAIVCAKNHHGYDIDKNGFPGWLIDTELDIAAARQHFEEYVKDTRS